MQGQEISVYLPVRNLFDVLLPGPIVGRLQREPTANDNRETDKPHKHLLHLSANQEEERDQQNEVENRNDGFEGSEWRIEVNCRRRPEIGRA